MHLEVVMTPVLTEERVVSTIDVLTSRQHDSKARNLPDERYVSLDAYPTGLALAGYPVRARCLARACFLGPHPAGFHVYGGDGNAFRACQPDCQRSQRRADLSGRSLALPHADHSQPGIDRHLRRQASVPTDQCPVPDRLYLFLHLPHLAAANSISSGSCIASLGRTLGTVCGVPGAGRCVLTNRQHWRTDRPCDPRLQLQWLLRNDQLRHQYCHDAAGGVDGAVSDAEEAPYDQPESHFAEFCNLFCQWLGTVVIQ